MSDENFYCYQTRRCSKGLISSILGRFEQRGFKLVGIKLVQPTESLLRTHYEDLQSKPFSHLYYLICYRSSLSYCLGG